MVNYDQIAQDLESGEARLSVTSLMIGAYTTEDKELNPADLLPVLGLATGRPVGASWIEFRDQNKNLIYRLHCNLGRDSYKRGRSVVHDMTNQGGLGKLLTEASKSGFIYKSLIRVALRNTANAISGEDLGIKFYLATRHQTKVRNKNTRNGIIKR